MEKKIEDKIATEAKTSPSNARQMLVLIKSAGIGFLFGFVLEKSKVYDPQIIRDQMIMKRFIMLKMFFSALASSTLMILLFRSRYPTAYAKVLESGSDALKKKSVKSVIAGGLILGLGMTIGGSCPGMIFVQLGAGVSNSLVALLGGLVGAYIHGLLNNALNFSLGKPNSALGSTLYEIFDKKPSVFHLGMAGALLGSSALIELVFPYKADLNIVGSPTSYGLNAAIWPPIFAGALLGSTQLISLLLLNQSLGNSTSFSVCASRLYTRAQLEASSYMKKFSTGNWDRFVMPIGVISGSFLSAYLAGTYGATSGLPYLNAFAGGFLLVFGARLAGGCNTGHGISGTGHLLLGSAIATASMFAGAMGLAFFLN